MSLTKTQNIKAKNIKLRLMLSLHRIQTTAQIQTMMLNKAKREQKTTRVILQQVILQQLHSKTIRTWRDTVTQRKLIDTLNQYIHNEQPVDALLLQETWNTMKGYIITCLTVT